jgi:hypothetical protein
MASPLIPWRRGAKGMVNAAYLAGKLLAALPRERCARRQPRRGGFIHPTSVEGRVEQAVEIHPARFRAKGLAEKAKFCRAFAEVTSH